MPRFSKTELALLRSVVEAELARLEREGSTITFVDSDLEFLKGGVGSLKLLKELLKKLK